MPTPATPVRLPLDCDPFDLDEIQQTMLSHLDEAIPVEGQPTPALHAYFSGHREVLAISPLASLPGFDLAATWQAIAARPGVADVILVAGASFGDGRLAAIVMGVERERGEISSWWAAIRGYEMSPQGIGKLTNPWEGLRGDGLPPNPFSTFTTAAPGASAWPLLPAKPPAPDMQAMLATIPDGQRLPTTALEMTEFVAASTMPTVEKKGIDHARVIRLRGREVEIWEIRGAHLPSSFDDLIRAICQRGESADAVGVAIATIFEQEGQRLHALEITAEIDNKRAQRIFTFHKPPGATKEVPSKTHWRELGPVKEGGAWLGVDPMVEWELGVIGVGE